MGAGTKLKTFGDDGSCCFGNIAAQLFAGPPLANSIWPGVEMHVAEPACNHANQWRGESRGEGIRVLAIVPGDPHGGPFTFARRQVAAVGDLGIEARTVFLPSRTSPFLLIRQAVEVWRELRRFRPHIVHAHFGTVTSFLGAVCAVLTKTALVITFRGSDVHGDPDSSIVRSHIARLLSQFSCLPATKIICVSRELRDRLWWRKEKTVVIPTGTDLHRFSPQSKDEARAILGWDPNLRVVVFSGKDQPRSKGLALVQEAVRIAERTVGPIRLELLHVPPEKMPCCLNAADCLALASMMEGSPNIVKEALACNLPVVATDVGDVSERLKDVKPARVVKRDAVEFGEALANILLENRRCNGRERGGLRSEEDVASALVAVYVSAIGTHDYKDSHCEPARILSRRL